MNSQLKNKTSIAYLMVVFAGALLAALLLFIPPSYARPASFPDPNMERMWDRTDKPIDEHKATRSWMWGPEIIYSGYEPFAESPNGQRRVSYFDKSRMEINNPAADRNSEWYVTNGLLVVEMISGRIPTGIDKFMQVPPAVMQIAGEPTTDSDTPTYASLASVASLRGDKRVESRFGQPVQEALDREGKVTMVPNLSGYAKIVEYEPTFGHNIPDVFWDFLNAQGIVYENGNYVNGTIIDWIFAMGYPITEPYWIKIKVDGKEQWALMQAYQRRILTYLPSNQSGWKVETANVGRAYYDWRYKQLAATPVPTATAVSAPTPGTSVAPSMILSPTAGNTNITPLTILGRNFPANSIVIIGAQEPDYNYSITITTTTSNAEGIFSAAVTLPSGACGFDEIEIVATANNGAVRAVQPFKLVYHPALIVADDVTVGKPVDVRGIDFRPDEPVSLGILFPDLTYRWIKRVDTSAQGTIDTDLQIDDLPVATTFQVIASETTNYKTAYTSKIVKVVSR